MTSFLGDKLQRKLWPQHRPGQQPRQAVLEMRSGFLRVAGSETLWKGDQYDRLVFAAVQRALYRLDASQYHSALCRDRDLGPIRI